MANVLITGGTGSLGTELTKTFLRKGHSVTILSRDPHKQAIMLAHNVGLRAILGDVRERALMLRACEDQDIVIHAAALKRIERGDTDTREYHGVNVLGTLNVAEACRITGVEKAVFISSDKCAAPINTYGFTKALGERLWLAENTSYRTTKFSCLRYGNVVESNGSVWHVWQRELARGAKLDVRYPEPTRFFLSLNDAVNYVLFTLANMKGGEIFVPSYVRAFSLWDLARVLQPEELWQQSHLLATEKQHEILAAPTEYVEPAGDGKLMWRIWPQKVPVIYETPLMFNSAEAVKLTGPEVVARLEAKHE